MCLPRNIFFCSPQSCHLLLVWVSEGDGDTVDTVDTVESPNVVRRGGSLPRLNPLQQQIGCSYGAGQLSTGVWSPGICSHPAGGRTRVRNNSTLLLPWSLSSSCISSYDCVGRHFLSTKWACSSSSSVLCWCCMFPPFHTEITNNVLWLSSGNLTQQAQTNFSSVSLSSSYFRPH